MESIILQTGRRKEAVAKVLLKKGNGKITVNGKDIKDYFDREFHIFHALRPIYATNLQDKYDLECTVKGGGKTGQAGALRMGIARALAKTDNSIRQVLSKEKLLTRDSRMVERKKYGRMKARRRYQFSKR